LLAIVFQKEKTMTQQSTSVSRRRGHNEGNFQKTKYGTWRAWVTLQSGDCISKILPTKTEAREWAQKKQMEVPKNHMIDIPFGKYISGWIEIHSSEIAESTQLDYKTLINKYIIPGLGHWPLHELHRDVFDQFYKSLREREKPVGNVQIEYIHRVIRKSLNDAVQDHVLEYNPRDGSKFPKRTKLKQIISPLTEKQAFHLVDVSMGYTVGH
jgi:hypothetical protein